jgi:hypothetical protein
VIVRPDTVISWHRNRFKRYWRQLSQPSGIDRFLYCTDDSVARVVRPCCSRHDRRRILHFNVTEHPTALWAAQQMVEAFPENTAPRYMVRDRDGIYGEHFRWGVEEMGIEEIRIAPKSPWQNCLAGDR